MKKVILSVVTVVFAAILLVQVQSVLAHDGDHNKPISSPISSPVTSPMQCKPGWGFGDKNHCHDKDFNPGKGHDKDHDNDRDDHHDNGHHDDHNNQPFVSPLGKNHK